MKRHCYNNLGEFYDNVKNVVNAPLFREKERRDYREWYGLSLANILINKFSYPIGVEKLTHFADFAVTKDEKVKFWNQDDGQEIDIDRMLEDLDFLLDTRKKRLLPKTADVYINVGEGADVSYNAMLCKTYAANKIVEKLETLGVRSAVFACASYETQTHTGKDQECGYLEIAIKQHQDMLNLGALCAAISPWMLRHWMILFITGQYRNVTDGCAYAKRMPSDIKGIIIDTGMCLQLETANKFIESIKM